MTVLLRLLAAALITLQVFAAGAMADHGRAGPGPDAAHLLCSQQQPDAQARALFKELAALTGLGGGSPETTHKDCPICALAHAASLPEAAVARPVRFAAAPADRRACFDRAGSRLPARPPVGLRAPPAPV
ncbi:MAG: hypothetical protein ACFE0P_14975 [Oceanicaulis sp.]